MAKWPPRKPSCPQIFAATFTASDVDGGCAVTVVDAVNLGR